MTIEGKLQSMQEKVNECEERLRRLEKLSKIFTQYVDTSSYEYAHVDSD